MGSFDFVLMTVEEDMKVPKGSEVYNYLKDICESLDKICEDPGVEEVSSECQDGSLLITVKICSFQAYGEKAAFFLMLDESIRFTIDRRDKEYIDMIFEIDLRKKNE